MKYIFTDDFFSKNALLQEFDYKIPSCTFSLKAIFSVFDENAW